MNSKIKILTSSEYVYWENIIKYDIIQTQRKTFKIQVNPDKSVIVYAPIMINIRLINDKIKSKARWIQNQLNYFNEFIPIRTNKKYVNWESFLYLGRQYILKVLLSEWNSVKLKWKFIELRVTSFDNNKKVLDNRYLENANRLFPKYIEKVLNELKHINKAPLSIKIKLMKSKWWSCSSNWRICLNSELIKAPRWCFEYVLYHELAHLVEFWHTKRFYNLLDTIMPDWKKWKNKLEKIMA